MSANDRYRAGVDNGEDSGRNRNLHRISPYCACFSFSVVRLTYGDRPPAGLGR
jgi:hypothetical protein